MLATVNIIIFNVTIEKKKISGEVSASYKFLFYVVRVTAVMWKLS
jgi:hypothetical protein